jgi:hypothetical protein
MAGFKVDVFRGMRPRVSKEKLTEGEGETVQNVDLGSGDLLPYDENATEQALNKQALSIYKYPNNGSPVWFEWEDRVTVVTGPVKDDSLERVYYVGDTTGDGSPKLTSNQLADQGGGGPYPEAWWYVGVPAPTVAPTVAPSDLPEDKDPSERIASQFRTDEFQIDKVQYTNYPGVGTDNDTWRLNSGALGSIAFDVLIGTAFKVKSVISPSRVTIESATEPGITMRTANSDNSTVNDWHPMDEQGSTKQADFFGWRVPPGMEVKIPNHNLNVGDVIVVSAINGRPEFYSALTEDHYAQNWSAETTVNIDGTDEFQHYNERISASATSGDSQYTISGTFYYDVDRASSDVSELEDRAYVYTYVNSLGEEGPPSPPSTVTPVLDGDDVLISGMQLPPTIGYDITRMRLYRSNSTEAGAEYQLISEFNVSRTYRDVTKSADLQEVIPSTSWDPPPDTLAFIANMPNGMLVAGQGRNIYFCDPYRPHAWPADYDQAIDYDVVGGISFSNAVCVLTTGWPYIITGSHPRNAVVRPIKINQACSSKGSIATDGDRVYYASPDGIVEISANGAVLKTENIITKKQWQAYSPSTMQAGFYEGKYYAFYDFDINAVDPVITAELSGDITNADEDVIIEDGATIVISLQNDTWVAAGTAFDNQRANIIAGLDAATSQTLGWNNLIRDSALQVSDVTRLSDTSVQIDVPATAGYAIDSSETITCTIPASALTSSNSAVVAGSTFTIVPKQHQTTLTLSGTLDGGAEASVVSGGLTVIMTLTDDTWITVANGFNNYRQEVIDNLKSTTDEDNGWNDWVIREIAVTDVVRTSDTVVTITLPAVANYAVTENETIQATIPHEILVTKENVDVTSSNSLGIIATGVPSAIFSGTAVSGGVTENEIVAGGETIIITLTNDTWVAAGTGPIGSTAVSDAIIDALISDGSATNGWNNEVLAVMDQTDLVRTSSTVATITMPAVAAYSISSNEAISCTLPSSALTGGSPIGVSNTFSVTAQDPITATMSGTLVSGSPRENDIVDGGYTIVLTLSSDTWKAAGTGPIGSTADTNALIDGIQAATSPANGWNTHVCNTAGAGVVSSANVVRTSDTVCTITLPAAASYDITADETITATIPTAAVNIAGSPVVASPTATVTYDVPATVAVTGTADGAGSRDIIAGGKTIILTVSDDTWVASGTAFNAQRQNIIDGLDAASSPAGGWNSKVRDVMGTGQVVRTSDTVVTITLPATSDYDVNADEVITVTVPASALAESAIPVTGDVTVDIAAYADGIDSWHFYTYADGLSVSDDNHNGATFYDPAYFSDDGSGYADIELPYRMVYSPGENQWVVTSLDVLGRAFGGLYTIPGADTDLSATTSRTSNHTGIIFSIEYPASDLWRTDTHDAWIHHLRDGVEWSSDGASWTDIESAISAGVAGTASSDDANSGSQVQTIFYGGNYVYIVRSVADSGNDEGYPLIRSADISGANTPATNWTAQVAYAFSESNQVYCAYGTGNGKILMVGEHDPGSGEIISLAYMNHGSTSFTLSSNPGNFPQLGVGGVFRVPRWLVYGENGVWIAMNGDSDYNYCDTGSGVETDCNNWSDQGQVDAGISAVDRVWYDKGAGVDDGWGFCVLARMGPSSTSPVELFTSNDGLTWTQRVDFDESSYYHRMAPRYAMMDSDFA